MKRILFLIAFTITTLLVNAQSDCNVFITSSFDSKCVLDDEKGNILIEKGEAMLACKESQVIYTATSSDATSYTWTIIGAYSYSTNGNTVTINWSNGNVGKVTVQITTSNGQTCDATKDIFLIEKPQIGSSSIPSYRWENGIKVIDICLGETVTFTNESATSNTDLIGHYWESIYGTASTENYTIENVMQGTKVTHRIINNCGCEAEETYEIRILEGQKLELSCYGTVCEGAEGTLYLVPNPASTYVKVEGIEQDDISELLLIDMTGKNLKKVQSTNTLDIQDVLKGTYILRVINKENKVYYLKLIKN